MIRVIRQDLMDFEEDDNDDNNVLSKSSFPSGLVTQEAVRKLFNIPSYTVLKLSNADRQLIPWSAVDSFEDLEVRVCRPHQNVKPEFATRFQSEELMAKRVAGLQGRIVSLEGLAKDPEHFNVRNEREMCLLKKQIKILANRLNDAETRYWIRLGKKQQDQQTIELLLDNVVD